MPESFPTWDEDAQALSETDYFDLEEIAALFHVSPTTARKFIAEQHWPHLMIARRVYMTAADIGAAIEIMRRGPIPEADGPPAFGIPVPDDPFLVRQDGDGPDPTEVFR